MRPEKSSHHIVFFCFGIALLGACWWQTLVHMTTIIWTVDTFSHGFFVPFISAGLLWSRRRLFDPKIVRFNWAGFVVLAASSLMWLLGEAAEIKFISHFAFVTAIEGIFLTCFGWKIFQRFMFPMLFLYMAIPVGLSLVAVLQTVTAELVIAALKILGVAVQAEGVLITISSGAYEVAQACAGIKFLFTSLVTGALLANIAYSSIKGRILILLAAALIPILANALRVLGILLISEVTDQSFAKGIDHIVYGWGFLSFVLFVLIAVAYRYSDKVDKEPPKATLNNGFGTESYRLAAYSPLLALLFSPLAMLMAPASVTPAVAIEKLTPPICKDCDFRLLPRNNPRGRALFRGADQQAVFKYRHAADTVTVAAALYCPQREGSRLVQRENAPAGEDWRLLPGVTKPSIAVGAWKLQQTTYWRGAYRQHLLVGYYVNQTSVSSALSAKFETAKERLFKGKSAGVMFVLSSTTYDGSPESVKKIESFLSTFSLDRFLWPVVKPLSEKYGTCVA